MKVNINQLLSTNYSKDKQFENRMLQRDNCLVGWVDSYNSENHTINVQPAIQSEIVTSQQTTMLKNKPFLINCPVISNTLSRAPQKGDKALILVLDEKSNNFFKTAFDTNKPIEQQTLVNQSKAYKTLSNCVAFVINPNPVKGGGGSTSLNSLKFEPSNERLQYQDGKATATGNFIYTTTESDTPVSITGSIQSNIIGGDGVVVDADETSTNLEIHLDSNVLTTEPQTFTLSEQEQVRQNIGAGTSDFSGNYNDLTNLPDIAIVKLVGTSDNPINLATDLDTGKAYILKGNISLSKTNIQPYDFLYHSNIFGQYSLTEQYFCLKNTDTSVYFIGTSLEKSAGGAIVKLRNAFGNSCTLRFNEQGVITGSRVYFSIMEINGSFSRDYTGPDNIQQAASFYAPFTSGNAGQILQSNGYGQAPNWVTPDYASSTDLETKLDKNQGATNAGKVLTVGDDGIVTPQDSGGSSNPAITTVTYENTNYFTHLTELRNLINENKLLDIKVTFLQAVTGEVLQRMESNTSTQTNIYFTSESIIPTNTIYFLKPSYMRGTTQLYFTSSIITTSNSPNPYAITLYALSSGSVYIGVNKFYVSSTGAETWTEAYGRVNVTDIPINLTIRYFNI